MTRSSRSPHTDENELVCWHYDHSKGRNVKGIHVVSALYRAGELSLPVACEAVEKTEWDGPDEEGRLTRHAKETKNEQLRRMVGTAVQTNRLPFGYVVADTWYASKENMVFLKEELARDFVMPLKSNRKVALSLKDKLAGHWRKVDALTYQENTTRQVWLEGVAFPLLLARQVFTNKDGSQGMLYLASSNTSTLTYELNSRRSTRNGGKSRNIIRASSRTLRRPNLPRARLPRRAHICSVVCMLSSSSNVSKLRLPSTISPSRLASTTRA